MIAKSGSQHNYLVIPIRDRYMCPIENSVMTLIVFMVTFEQLKERMELFIIHYFELGLKYQVMQRVLYKGYRSAMKVLRKNTENENVRTRGSKVAILKFLTCLGILR